MCPGAVLLQGQLQAWGGDKERVPKGGPSGYPEAVGVVGVGLGYREAGACLRCSAPRAGPEGLGLGISRRLWGWGSGPGGSPRPSAVKRGFPGTAILQGPEDGGRRGRG